MSELTLTDEERAAELDRIRGEMIKKEFFIMHRRSAAPERKKSVVLEHFRWIVELEKQGRILMTGGIFLEDGTQTEGLTIFRADTWQEAEELAASDPVVQCGADTFYIERFRLGGGRISLTVDFSDQSFRLD